MNASSFASSLFVAIAQTAPAPESAEPQLLDIDGTVFVMLGLFLVTMFLLTQLLWKPYLRVREERVARVDGYKDEARRLEAEASTRLARVESQLGEARRAGSAERARVRTEALHREQAILASAQAAAQKTLAEARARIETALAGERANLKARAEALGREAAEKVLGRRVAS
jgi:F0F1-type ATP synthase membrane subunit b/b'